MSDSSRNPLLIPTSKETHALRGCPKCKAQDYTGRMSQGTVLMTCGKCRNQWHGGIGQEPLDPTIPSAPINPSDRPAVQYTTGAHGEILEQRRRISTQQEFRKGLPIPEGEE